MTRPSRAMIMMALASTIAERSTCRRRRVGCVLTDAWGRVLSMGHNGAPRGMSHCLEHACVGADQPSGQGLDLCQAIHAEQNAIMFCPDVMKIQSCWVTTAPCVHCVKMLLNTTCQEVVFLEPYAHESSEILWLHGGRSELQPPRRWLHLEEYE